jgi:hypothetical protein
VTVRRVTTAAVALLAAFGLSVLTARPASADPAKPTNDESKVLSLQPSTDAVSLRVVGGDGFLELHVRHGHEATVEGYGGEPWLRVLRDGTVEENTRSPATYLDANRYARDITVPPDADPKAPPRWQTVGHDGHWVWHDHRIHWMNPGVAPPMMPGSDQVRMGDREDGRWVVPMRVDGRPVAVIGELIRHPAPGPALPLLVIAGFALAGLAASFLLRGQAARLRGASVVALAAACAAIFAGYETVRAVPRVAGGSYLVVIIPLGGLLVGFASLALRTGTSKCLAVLGAAGCVLGWGLYQLETLWKAVPLSVLPHLAARVLMAAALGAAFGAAILAVRSGALAMPAPVVARASEPADGSADPSALPQADSATRR